MSIPAVGQADKVFGKSGVMILQNGYEINRLQTALILQMLNRKCCGSALQA